MVVRSAAAAMPATAAMARVGAWLAWVGGFGLVFMVGSCWWFVAMWGDQVMSRSTVRRVPAAANPAT